MSHLRVLLVEDDPSIAEAVTVLLRTNDMEVTWVDDGESGYQALLEGGCDIAVLDVLLPGRNGYVICRDARSEGVDTPIIMLTAKTGAYDEAEALELGADDFLSKPFEPVVLVARLAALARRGRPTTAPAAASTLEVDLTANKVTYGDITASLSPREAQLAAAIAEGDGEPVPKETLLAKVWGDRGDANTVEVYVGYLRRKLRAAFGDQVRVDTVRWAGYRLVTGP